MSNQLIVSGSDIESDEEGSRSGDDDSDKAFASDLDSDDDSDQSQVTLIFFLHFA